MATILLANVKWAVKQPWGRKIWTALDKIHRAFPYNHEHNVKLLAAIVAKLARADAVQGLNAAPMSKEQANLV